MSARTNILKKLRNIKLSHKTEDFKIDLKKIVPNFKNNEKFSGCTVHFVNSKLDSGKIILQKKVKITKKDTFKTLKKKILREEHMLYPKAIKKIFLSQ